jgi:hypothetical protein
VTARDTDLLVHRLDQAVRSLNRIRQHLVDLHWLAHETPTADVEKVRTTKTDRTPRGGDPHAKRLWERATLEVGRTQDTMIGLERDIIAYFYAHSSSPEPSRGSLIPAAEHDRLLANQQARRTAGHYTPTLLGDQPTHPGHHR